MNDYLVSIIIPCYNVEKYLDRCLETVVNQTYSNLEIILVDDGSTDNTPKLCDKWASDNSRISVIHKENDGLANARNTGINAMTGDYAMFIDSDDFVDNDIVEFLLNLSVKYDADVSRCGFYQFENNKNTIKSYSDSIIVYNESDKDKLFIDLIDGGHVSGVAWNKLYKREIIQNHLYDKADGCSEDILHNFRVYKDTHTTVFYDLPKYHYCINDNSITNSKFGYGAFDIIRARNIMIEYFKGDSLVLPYAKEWYVRSAYIVISGCIRFNSCMDRYEELREGIKSNWRLIFFSNRFSLNIKIRTALLIVCPKLYNNLLIKKKGLS